MMNTKRIRRTVLFAAFSIILAAVSLSSTSSHAADASRAAPIFDGGKSLVFDLQEKVKEPRVINRTPIFDNAPFLKLKKGAQLVKAKGWLKGGKGDPAHFEKLESHFLQSNGKYYRLDWGGREKPVLLSAYLSLLFDWNVTLANAKILTELDKPNEPLVIQKFASLKNALRKDFPETLRDVGKIEFDAPLLVGKGKTRRAIFRVLAFSRYSNTVFMDQFEIGNRIHIVYRKNLINGPRRVERREFEGKKGGGINSGVSYRPDPKTAEKARIAFKRMEKFRTIVNKFLVHPAMAEG